MKLFRFREKVEGASKPIRLTKLRIAVKHG